MNTLVFDHERLDVYRASIDFNAWAGVLLDGPLAKCALNVAKHLDQAAASITLNIAEGNGRRSHKDRCRFLDISRGSALECVACLDVLVARKALQEEETVAGKGLLKRIMEMLYRLVERLLANER
ncbi:MAG: four helix bundle protein [Planctomycetota bacterium]